MNVGEAYVTIRPDTKGFAQETEKEVGGAFKKVGQVIASAFVVKEVGQFFSSTIKAASDLAEQMNKNKVVFGGASKVVTDFAKTSAKDIGLSERAALEAAGTYGNLFRAIGLTSAESAKMSTRLLTLSADLASFNNANPEEVFMALKAGLVGETEPLKRFGVNLNEARLKQEALNLGLSNSKAPLDANAKAQAAYSLILKDTGLAQGDFANTSDSLANRQRILSAQFEDTKAKIGAALLPAMTVAVGAVSALAGAFGELPAPLQAAIVGTAGFAAAIVPIVKIGSAVITAVSSVVSSIAEYAKVSATGVTASGNLASKLGMLTNSAFGPLGLALAGATLAVVAFSQSKKDATARVDTFVKALERDSGALAENSRETLINRFEKNKQLDDLSKAGVKIDDVVDALDAYNKKTSENTDETRRLLIASTNLGDGQEYLAEELAGTNDTFDKLILKLAQSGEGNDGLTTTLIHLADEYREAKQVIGDKTDLQGEDAKSVDNLAASTDLMAQSQEAANKELDAFNEILEKAIGGPISLRDAQIALLESNHELHQSVIENGKAFDLNSAAAIENVEALDAVIESVVEEGKQLAISGRFAEGSAEQHQFIVDKLNAYKKEFPGAGAILDEHIRLLGGVKTEAQLSAAQHGALITSIANLKTTKLNEGGWADNQMRYLQGLTLTAGQAAGAYQRLQETIGRLTAGTSFIGPNGPRAVNRGMINSASGNRASGGSVTSGQTYLVGESGPEYLTMGGHGWVTPPDKATQTSVSPVYNFNIQSISPNVIASEVDAALRRSERLYGIMA